MTISTRQSLLGFYVCLCLCIIINVFDESSGTFPHSHLAPDTPKTKYVDSTVCILYIVWF